MEKKMRRRNVEEKQDQNLPPRSQGSAALVARAGAREAGEAWALAQRSLLVARGPRRQPTIACALVLR